MTPSSFFHSSTPVAEVETFSKPGTADVTAGDRKKLSGLLKHYGTAPHGFTKCKRDQMKHGLTEDHANRRCAVIMDLAKGTTKWRGKDKKVAEEVIAEALGFLQEVGTEFGGAALVRLMEQDSEVFAASKIVESAPRWMLPVAARQPGFKPSSPEKGSSSEFNKKHPRGSGTQGGQFVRKGSSGVEVGAVQQRLGVTRTNTFTGQTKRRVEKFQKNHGLSVDGVVGAQTVAAMRGQKAAPGALSKNDRRYLRRYARRT